MVLRRCPGLRAERREPARTAWTALVAEMRELAIPPVRGRDAWDPRSATESGATLLDGPAGTFEVIEPESQVDGTAVAATSVGATAVAASQDVAQAASAAAEKVAAASKVAAERAEVAAALAASKASEGLAVAGEAATVAKAKAAEGWSFARATATAVSAETSAVVSDWWGYFSGAPAPAEAAAAPEPARE